MGARVEPGAGGVGEQGVYFRDLAYLPVEAERGVVELGSVAQAVAVAVAVGVGVGGEAAAEEVDGEGRAGVVAGDGQRGGLQPEGGGSEANDEGGGGTCRHGAFGLGDDAEVTAASERHPIGRAAECYSGADAAHGEDEVHAGTWQRADRPRAAAGDGAAGGLLHDHSRQAHAGEDLGTIISLQETNMRLLILTAVSPERATA